MQIKTNAHVHIHLTIQIKTNNWYTCLTMQLRKSQLQEKKKR